jgi:hypothetical protein
MAKKSKRCPVCKGKGYQNSEEMNWTTLEFEPSTKRCCICGGEKYLTKAHEREIKARLKAGF